MRSLSFLALLLSLILAACDGNSGGKVPAETVKASPPLPFSLTAETDTLRLDLTTVFRSSRGTALTFAVVSGPPGATLLGTALVIPPQPVGNAAVSIRASAGTATASARIEATYSLRGPVTTLRPFAPVSVKAGKDSLTFDLRTFFDAARPIAFVLTGAPDGVRLAGSTLIVMPADGGTFSVTVTASAPGYAPTSGVLTIESDDRWCQPTAPPGTFDPLPFQTGETATFAYMRSAYRVEPDTARGYSYEGWMTWTVLSRRCASGGLALRLRQRVTYTQLLSYSRDVVGPPIDSTTEVRVIVPTTGTLPPIGPAFRGRLPAPRWMPDPRFETRLSEDRGAERWTWFTTAIAFTNGLASWQERLDRYPFAGGDMRYTTLVLTRR